MTATTDRADRGGAKLTGRQADYNIGVLDVATRTTHDLALPGGVLDGRISCAARVSRNMFKQSWIGGIVTHGNPTGAGEQHARRRRRALRHLDVPREQESLARSVRSAPTTRRRESATAPAASASTIRTITGTWSLNWKQIGDNFNAGARLRARDRHPHHDPGRSRFSRGPIAGASGSSSSSSSPSTSPTWKSRRELACLHGAVQHADRVGRASGVELHSGIRAPRRALRDQPGRDHPARLVSVARAIGPK